MPEILSKEIFGILAVIVAVINYGLYIYSIRFRNVRPHIFSWVIWCVLTFIAFAVQWFEGAGAGSWVTGMVATFCFLIVVFTFKTGERNITRSDKTSFIVALSAIPLWLITKDPLFSVILVTVIDMIGYYPTFRKSYDNPHKEPALCFFLGGVGWVFAIVALENYSLTTFLYPAALILANFTLILFLLIRRQLIGKKIQ